MEINQYPLESFSFQDQDYYDIDFWTGSGYQTKKILGSVIKAGILAAVENIYNSDGTLNSDRIVDLNSHLMTFSGTNSSEQFKVQFNDGTGTSSVFLQTLAQIYCEFLTSASSNVASFDLNPVSTQLKIQDGTNESRFEVTIFNSAINFNDGVTNYRVAANTNGIEINSSYYLPATDGTAGQIIKTDGFGTLSWIDAPTTIVSWGDIVGTLADQTDLQAALDAKQETLVSGTNIKTIEGQSLLGSGNIDLTKTDVGLSNVDNTSDINKPISTATQTALNLKQDTITLTTTGTSGPATFVSNTLNVPNYSSGTDTNIYNTDGTLLTDRVVTMNNFSLSLDGGTGSNGSLLILKTNASNRSKSLNFQVGSNLRWKQRVSGVELGADDGSSLAFDYYTDAGTLKGTALQLNRTDGSLRLNNAYNLPVAAGLNGQVMRTNGSGIVSFQSLPTEIQVAASDEITALTAGTGKTTFRLPYAMTLTEVRASLTTAQTSGLIFTIDIIYNGVSVLATKITIDNTEKTSTTAVTLPVITTSALADDGEIRIDVTQIGDGTAKGLKVTLKGTRS